MTHLPQSTRKQKGAGLLEVLVAVVILSLGLLGMAGLQARALKGNHSSFQRSQAVMLSYYILDAIRADSRNALSYNMGMTCTAPSGSSLVANTQAAWITNLKTALGSGDATCGRIACATAGDGTLCTVTIQWDDSRAGGRAQETLETRTRL